MRFRQPHEVSSAHTDGNPSETHLDEFVTGNPVRGLALSVDELKRHFLARCVRRAHCDVEAGIAVEADSARTHLARKWRKRKWKKKKKKKN